MNQPTVIKARVTTRLIVISPITEAETFVLNQTYGDLITYPSPGALVVRSLDQNIIEAVEYDLKIMGLI